MTARIVLTNMGSLGNIQPFVALAAELRKSNHVPVLALAPQYTDYIRKLGFEFVPIGPQVDYLSLQKRDTASELRGGDPLYLFANSLNMLSSALPQMFSELHEACRHADLLISGHLQPASRMIHEITGIPFVSIHTSHFGALQPRAFRQVAGAILNPFRARWGLPQIEDPLHVDANSDQLALYAMSRYLRPPGPNWPPHYHAIGFFFFDEVEWRPEPELAAFMKAGPRPVVFTFSSIVHEDPKAITEQLMQSALSVGKRAVILAGWSGLGTASPHPSIYMGNFVQHSWLFPKAACVVHAGGSGTTAMTLRSGIPAIIVPHIGDQPIWAELVRGIGCAKCVIPYRELSVPRLRDAISMTLSEAALARNAWRIGEKIKNEPGVAGATRLINELLKPKSRCGAETQSTICRR